MEIKTLIIDDEPLALELLKNYISHFPRLQLVAAFNDPIEAIAFIKQNEVDLLFVDINMPDMSGLELVKALPGKLLLIFTTAYKQFALDGFDLDAVDYLLKPVPFERFTRAVNKAISLYDYNQEKNGDTALYVRSDYQVVKIELNDIEYIESISDYLKIHLISGEIVMTLMTLKAILGKLPPAQFKRIHRSYVVTLNKVKSFSYRKAILPSAELPVSEKYQDIVKEWKNRETGKLR
jgi:two-component system, LytTR family, response regulator